MTPPLRVDRVVAREIRVPLKRPFEIASGAVEQRRVLLLELAHPDGLCVWSECVAGEAPDYAPETVDTARLALRRWFAPRLLDVEITHPGEAFDRLRRSVRGTGWRPGRACNAALAALPGFELPGDIYPPERYLTEDIVTPGWTAAPDGTVGVPTRGRGSASTSIATGSRT